LRNEQDEQALGRREFTTTSILAMLGGVAITISGCSDDKPTQPSQPAAEDKTGTISANHGHVAVVTAAQQTTGAAVTLSIQGTAAHTHTVDVTVAELVNIRAGQRVAKDSSSTNSHTHTVTFN